MDNNFPPREHLKDSIANTNNGSYQESLLSQLESAVESSDSNKWTDEPDIKITQIESQKEYVWIRVYLYDEDTILKSGDIMKIRYVPRNEELEVVFGAYEKVGINKDNEDEVINYVTDNDRTILCCMVDTTRINKDSDDIPMLRTFFRSSRYYTENLFRKTDLEISMGDTMYEYSSISF